MFVVLAENIRLISATVTSLVAIVTGYVYFEAPVPASKSYVIAQAEAIKADNKKETEIIRKETKGIKNGLVDIQLQLNSQQRSVLRSEKTSRQIELEAKPEQRPTILQKIEQIDDDLQEIQKQREKLLQQRDSQ